MTRSIFIVLDESGFNKESPLSLVGGVAGGTTLTIDLEGDLDQNMSDEFAQMWPKALEKLKELVEKTA